MPIAVLRIAIEMRLRHAFCVYLVSDPANPQKPVFVDMSVLFEAIEPFKSGITFGVDIDDVGKIYGWSNLSACCYPRLSLDSRLSASFAAQASRWQQ
jgi:hypothetical protein